MKTGPLAQKKAKSLMGAPKMNLEPIHQVLGDDMPQIDASRVGRFRLTQALRNRFGVNYQNHPDSKAALDHFDSEHHYLQMLAKLKGDPS